MNTRECIDHKGNKFSSIKEMCEYWDVNYEKALSQLNSGYSFEHVIEKAEIEKKSHITVDHTGHRFSSFKALCAYWGMPEYVVESRLMHGWDVKKAVTYPINKCKTSKVCQDHLGNKFATIKDMCDFWHIKETTFRARINRGSNLRNALVAEVKENILPIACTDHLGNHYDSMADMCKHWKISSQTVNARLEKGMSLKDALETPCAHTVTSKACMDHKGNKYDSISDMCKVYGILPATYRARREKGMSVKDSLERSTIRPKKRGK